QIIEALAIIPVTILAGRFFCGWMCAFGTLGDILYKISGMIFKVPFTINEKADRALKKIKYVVLGFIIIAGWSFGIVNLNAANPWNAFGSLATVGKVPDFYYAASKFTIGFFILLAIISASFFVERFFCRYLCPMGAVFAIISKLKLAKIKKPKDKCGSCKICTKSCAMGINLYEYNKINSGECINCLKCVSSCPRKNVSINVANEDIRSSVAAAAAVTAMTGFYYAGSFMVKTPGVNGSVIAAANVAAKSDNTYSDGTYEGVGNGFRGGVTTVSVTVKDDAITDIKLVSHGDDAPYFNRAYSPVVQKILSTQSTDVDAVSGATFSSLGIMDAVTNALEKARSSSMNY
ncbi:MAG TPA: 4Fe-4S binding protein, partial [Clostridia bacterium]